ncbi:MAG TPA: ABC transporter ATP-binding protein [Mycobacteriales bacterium]|jgi:branched-chain amino acid transport system ATP-binding protein|nr:ABC transporter ATP-binding protein [Mycobacteriales bacterium]
MREKTALEVEGITAGYGGAPIIHDVSLRVDAGTITAIVGPNGAGKSTLLKSLAGLVKISSGTARIKAQPITSMRTERLAGLGVAYVPQVANIFPGMTVRENLEIGGYRRKAGLSQRIDEICDLFPDLRPALRRKAGTLSGGQRSMLAMARGLMIEPTVMLLDEPSAGLSPLFQTALWEQIRSIADTGVGVCVVEQNTRRTLKYADWAYVLVLGRNRLDGPAQELLHNDEVVNLYVGRLN